MVSIVQGPGWFLTPTIGIEILSAVILGIIAITVLRFYFISKKHLWLRLGSAFALLSTAALGHAVLTWGIFAKSMVVDGGVVVFSISPYLARSVTLFVLIFVLEFLMLYGLYLLFTSYHETSKTSHGLVAFLLLLTLFFSVESYFVFHLIGLVFSLLITVELFVRTREKKLRSGCLARAFLILSASKLSYLLVPFNALFFVGGVILQVLALLLIAKEYLGVKNAKKIKA